MFCPYCGQDRDPSTFTNEHVLTRALGGNLTPTNPFLLKVCGPCNSTCGRWVDGPFVRSWLVYNARAQCAFEYVDPSSAPTLPLVFLGPLEGWASEGSVCDGWLGPTGDQIYHFHQPYPEPAWVGGPPGAADQIDPGIAFVFLVGTNPLWHPIIFRSIADNFPGATVHYLNAGPTPSSVPWPAVPADRNKELDWVRKNKDTGWLKAKMVIDIHGGDRFLMKVGLGLATLFLDPTFPTSTDATFLRSALWAKSPGEFEKLKVPGSGFLGQMEGLDKILEWNGCHVILLQRTDDSVAAVLNFYGRLPAMVRVCSAEHGAAIGLSQDGMVWVVSPGLRTFFGPMTIPTFISEKEKPTSTGIQPLLKRMEDAIKIPPFHLPASKE